MTAATPGTATARAGQPARRASAARSIRRAAPARAADADPPGTETRPLVLPESVTRLERPWSVVVWDDPVNLMSYVVYVFQRLFGFSEAVAHEKMMEVHEEGRSVVASEDRERAEYYVGRLHGYGLKATLERAGDG